MISRNQSPVMGRTPEPAGLAESVAASSRGLRMSQSANQKQRANRALDATNFFLADVRDGLGPYLAIYLLTEQKWDEAHIGMVMSAATIAGIVAQTPAGALIDATKAKRLVMVVAALFVTAASLLLPIF